GLYAPGLEGLKKLVAEITRTHDEENGVIAA
ncbi:hypothetical protein L915_15702, partial [Phytophthora nicotianae]